MEAGDRRFPVARRFYDFSGIEHGVGNLEPNPVISRLVPG